MFQAKWPSILISLCITILVGFYLSRESYPKVEIGTCVAAPKSGDLCSWVKSIYDDKTVKVSIIRDSASKVIIKKDSVIQILQNGHRHKTYSYAYYYNLETGVRDSVVENNVLKVSNTFQLLSSYTERFEYIAQQWQLKSKSNKQYDLLNQDSSSYWHINYLNGTLEDSTSGIESIDYTQSEQYVFSNNEPFLIRSSIYSKESKEDFNVLKKYRIFDRKKDDYGLWCDSTKGNIEYYQENVETKGERKVYFIDFSSDLPVSYWSTDSINRIKTIANNSMLNELLKKRVKSKKLHYSLIVNTDGKVCYESAELDFKTIYSKKSGTNSMGNCKKGKKLMYISVYCH